MIIEQGTHQERAIVLHTTKYGERRLIVHALTKNHGRQSYMITVSNGASGVSRGLLQPLYLINFLSSSKGGSLHAMRDVQLSPPTQGWSSSSAKSMIVMFVAELLYRLVNDSDEAMFNFFEEEILALSTMDASTQKSEIANFHLHFMVQLAVHLGYAPTGNYQDNHYFDIKQGCFVPLRPVSHSLYFDPPLALLLHQMLTTPRLAIGSIALTRDLRRQFLNSMVDYFGFHTQSIYSVRSIELFSF